MLTPSGVLAYLVSGLSSTAPPLPPRVWHEQGKDGLVVVRRRAMTHKVPLPASPLPDPGPRPETLLGLERNRKRNRRDHKATRARRQENRPTVHRGQPRFRCSGTASL